MHWFLTILISFNLYAVDEIRLDKSPYPGANLPVRSQADSGLCYAYASAYLIDYERNDSSFETSPLLFAIDYKQSLFFNINVLPDGGHACEAINKVKRVFNKNDDKNLVENFLYYKILEELEYFYNRHSDYFTEQGVLSTKKLIPMDSIKCSTFNVLNQTLGLNKSFQEIDSLLSSPTFMTFISRAILPAEPAQKINLKCSGVAGGIGYSNEKAIISKLEEALDHKKPALIDYCVNVLHDGKSYSGLDRNLPSFANPIKVDCLPHSSVVVGKRIKNGEIQYLIQDSNGPEFVYHSDFENESGRIWVDQKTLLSNVFNVSYIK